jgi:hypothetical protein
MSTASRAPVIASKPVARTRSLDDPVDLAADELGDRVVGCHVEPEVRIRAPQRNQAPLCPRGLGHNTAFKYEEFRSLIRIESALAIMSGHTGVDFSTLDLDDNVADVDAQGIRGLFDAILRKNDGKPVTVREAAERYGMAMGAPTAVGTPADVADEMEHYLDEGGCDGFMLLATNVPGCFVDIAELVVPELQRRGRYRLRYPGTTLRESLLEY